MLRLHYFNHFFYHFGQCFCREWREDWPDVLETDFDLEVAEMMLDAVASNTESESDQGMWTGFSLMKRWAFSFAVLVTARQVSFFLQILGSGLVILLTIKMVDLGLSGINGAHELKNQFCIVVVLNGSFQTVDVILPFSILLLKVPF